MTTLNNVNVSKLEQVAREAETDKSKLRRTQQIEGEWLLTEGGPQFRAEVSFEGGKIVMESDQPKNLGGGGIMGIELKMLIARLEGNLNFSRVFGLSQEPVMEEIRITLQVVSDAPREKLEEVEKLAYERCPAVFALTEPVKLKTNLEITL